MAGSCLAQRNGERGTFVYTGNGGLPITPYDYIDEGPILSDDRILQQAAMLQRSQQQDTISSQATAIVQTDRARWKIGDPINEAQGIVKTADGRTLLGSNLQQAPAIDAQSLVCHG